MNIHQFATLIQQQARSIDDALRRKLPVMVGAAAKQHFQEGFRRGGFIDSTLQRWKPSARIGRAGGVAGKHGTLLSSRNHLMRSITYSAQPYRVTVYTDVPYAPLHNEGGTTHVRVTPKMRKYAWAMFYRSMGIKRGGAKKTKRGKAAKPETEQARLWKALALTRKQGFTIRIPKRKFMGDSVVLRSKANAVAEEELSKILKL